MLRKPADDPDAAFLSTLTVLYAEDDDLTRESLGEFLRRRVGRLILAANGADGLQRFQSERPSMVVTDIRMPGMDGLAMVTEIHRLDARVPVIVTTAFEQVDYLERSIEAGVDRYVVKPVDTNKLEAALSTCVRRLRAEAALAEQQEREIERLHAHERDALRLLAGGMAHDFNNMLQGVIGNLDLLTPTDDDQRACVEDARTAASQARTLGEQLLTLSETSFQRPALRASPLGPTLRSAVAFALEGSTTALRLEVAPSLPEVPMDPEMLEQGFACLARNAREAMRGGGALKVTASERTLATGELPPLAAGAYVQVTFRDAGPGVPAEILPRIFDPYFSTKPRGAVRGMGLGLSLCQAIVRRHQGLVVVAPPTGAGAVFHVLLPAAPATRG